LHFAALKLQQLYAYLVGSTVLTYKNLAKAVLSFPSKEERDIDQIISLMALPDALFH